MIKNIRALVVIAAMVLFPVSVFAEDVPMTEEEICFGEDYAIEAQTEEDMLIVSQEEEFLEEDGLVEDDEILEAADGFDFEEAFPDKKFRNYLEDHGLTSPSSFDTVESLFIQEKEIRDLTGIKYFTNLKLLDCNDNLLTSLDVSGLTKLEKIDYFNNQLTVLNASGCTSLTQIGCNNNQLTGLDVSGCTSLDILLCSYNQLTSLDVSECTSLKTLLCYNNQLTAINTSGCSSLVELNCASNKLQKLDVSTCTSLGALVCSSNPLQSVDVSFCPNLDMSHIYADDTTRILWDHEHAWDGGKVTKKPTTTAEGVKTYTCTIAACGKTNTEKIPKLKANTPAEKITISKKPSIKKPAATKSKITVKWKHFKHTSKKTKPIWKKIKKVQVQCATDKGFKNIIKDVKIGKSKTKYAIKGLAKKTAYYVRVRYFDGTGYSDWSKVKKVKTK